MDPDDLCLCYSDLKGDTFHVDSFFLVTVQELLESIALNGAEGKTIVWLPFLLITDLSRPCITPHVP